MPEGPEIWFLSMAINFARNNNFVYYYSSYGKHLLIYDQTIHQYEDWTFGLTGKVKINEDGILEKCEHGWIIGKINKYNDIVIAKQKLGLDWMTSQPQEIIDAVIKWKSMNKSLASLLLDQSLISGIGVAWGSEILHHAGLNPQMKSRDADPTILANSILFIRKVAITLYSDFLNKATETAHYVRMVNEWFDNLYACREKSLCVYKKGTPLKISGRTWWV